MPVKLSEIDEVLIRYADTLSAEALSFKIEGVLTPVQVMGRIAYLLEAPDRLTLLQQDQLITMRMRQLVNKLEELPVTTRSVEVALNGLEKIGNRLDKRQESTEKELSTLYAFQGTVLLDAVTIALNHMKSAITGGDKIAADQWDAAMESGLRLAQIELSKHDADAPDELTSATTSPNSLELEQ